MSFKAFFILIFSVILFTAGLPKHLQKKVEKEIKDVFQVETFEFAEKLFDKGIVASLPSTFNNANFFEIKKGTETLGYAYVSKAPSKTDEFDYLVLFHTDLKIARVKILAYREDYGGEIGSKRWLKQFGDKTMEDSFKVGTTVDAISGATISVNSMTLAMDNLMKSLRDLRSKQLL